MPLHSSSYYRKCSMFFQETRVFVFDELTNCVLALFKLYKPFFPPSKNLSSYNVACLDTKQKKRNSSKITI